MTDERMNQLLAKDLQQPINNADDTYHRYLQGIMDNGHVKTDRTGTGTKSLFGQQMRFNLREGFPLLTTKKVFTKGIIHELLWFLKGSTNIQYLLDNDVHIWDEWADKHGDLGPVYGAQWRSWPGKAVAVRDDRTEFEVRNSCSYQIIVGDAEYDTIDQIADAIKLLKNSPDSRRIIVSAWNPAEVPQMKLPPCHALFQFYTRTLSLDERVAILDARTRDEETKFRNSIDAEHEMRSYAYGRRWLPTDDNAAHVSLDTSGIPRLALSCQLYQRSIH